MRLCSRGLNIGFKIVPMIKGEGLIYSELEVYQELNVLVMSGRATSNCDRYQR